jgi:uncharacterized Zn-binding protein involved in type VI secretion
MAAKPAARLSDTNACPQNGHGPNPIASGSPNVLFDNLPVARVGDSSACGDVIVEGIANILVNGKPIAHLGSATAHGGVIISGSGNILVGTEVSCAPFTPPEPMPGLFDEHFVLLESDTGLPIANHPYRLCTASGKTLEGVTDEQGKTAAISAWQAELVVAEFDIQTEIVIA